MKLILPISFLGMVICSSNLFGSANTPKFSEESVAFFEKQIRPVLVGVCYECHQEKRKGGLFITNRSSLLLGGDSGPAIVPFKPEASILIEALHYGADSYQMPPKGKLPDKVIRHFEEWIRMGAPWPASENLETEKRNSQFEISDEDRQFWSFQPISNPDVPVIKNENWANNGIDKFILKELQKNGLPPSQRVQKIKLIRRATFNLTGLPPSTEEVEDFINDSSEQAFEKVIDRLLDSPRYGEHWGRRWLDGVRYVSDVGYYNFSDLGWRYRDWVVQALNKDMPYDQFIIHQIAGDLLDDPQGRDNYAEGIIATGVLAMGNYDDQESDKEKLYAEVVDDQIDLIGRQFLGLTISCARCHDHKFDPISIRDYYALGGIFMSTSVLETKSRIGAHRLKIPLESDRDKRVRQEIEAEISKLESQMKESSAKSRDIIKRINFLKKNHSIYTGVSLGIVEGGPSNSRHKGIKDMSVYIRGNPYKLGDVIPRRIPSIFNDSSNFDFSNIKNQSGRLELARWIASPENPLTARVIVNRIWSYHFGQGLVQTTSNFGKQGSLPSHPILLDYLARQLIDSGWSMKHIHRIIMNSATYQQASLVSASGLSKDPENKLLSRFQSRRLTAEEIHDSLLSISQRLKPEVGQGHGNRLIYSKVGHEYISLVGSLFDAPPTGTIVPTRNESTTAPQALYMMNDKSVIQASKALTSLLREHNKNILGQIRSAYRILFSRQPTDKEISAGLQYLKGLSDENQWTYYQVLLCSNEFMYLD